MKYIADIEDNQFIIDILDDHHILLDGEPCEVDFEPVGDQQVYSLILNGKSSEAYIYPCDDVWQVLLMGRLFQVRVVDEHEKRLRESAGNRAVEHGEFLLKSPMPGLIVSIPIRDGQEVSRGDVLIILESMKMQNELKSPRDGKVDRIRVKIGENVEQKQLLLSVV